MGPQNTTTPMGLDGDTIGRARFRRLLDERNKARQVAAAEEAAAAAAAAAAAQSEASGGDRTVPSTTPTKEKEVRSVCGGRSNTCSFLADCRRARARRSLRPRSSIFSREG